MSNFSRAIFLFLTIVAVLFVSAVGTTSVYADDGTPPPPPTETEVVDPSTGGGSVVTEPTETAPTSEPVATEPATVAPTSEPVATEPAEAAPPVEEAPVVAEQPSAETEAVSILEQVPDNTTVTVLNTEGEAQPLTTQESADTILTGDPVWCPKSQSSPTPGANGCTPSFPSFDALLSYLSGNAAYQGAGTIYVQQGAYTGGESSIDFNSPTYDLSYINNYNLTVQGGWDTVNSNTNPANTTQFNIPIIIGTSTNPWVGSLTFNNISISEVYGQTGLTLFSQADITLSNVEVTNSLGGADLNAGGDVTVEKSKFDNNKQFGAKINAGGAVYLTDSEFNRNAVSKDVYDGFGLQVNSQDEVFIDTISASYNEKFGADITATGPVTVLNSFFSGNISYTHNCSSRGTYGIYCNECKETANGGYGLKIVTADLAYLDGVTANDNYLFGAHVEAAEVEINNRFGNNSFSNNGSGSPNDPKGYGLEVVSTGGVSLIGVEASNNQLFGANIRAGQKGVTIRKSFFDGNKSYKCSCSGTTYYGYGLQVVTTGNITLVEVSAVKNNLFGAHLEGSEVVIAGGIFSNNGSGSSSVLTGKGLEINSTANVTLANIEANNNQLFGANIQASGSVTISVGFFNGHKVYTYSCKGKKLTGGGYGLQIVTNGAIALSGVEASDNYLFGAHLKGSTVAVAGDVSNYSSFNDNQAGLNIESSGSISLNYIEANGNKLSGATIAGDGMVSIANSLFNGNQSYTYSPCKGKKYYGYGLQVVTKGPISLLNVQALNNYVYGAHLEGSDVNIGSSSFSNNGTGVLSDHIGKGLEIVSTGSSSLVSLLNVTANDNQLFGANIQADGLVLISSSVFSGNKSYTSTCSCKTYDGYGLKVVTTSNIGLDSVTANGNYLFGAHLEGKDVSISGGISPEGVFSNNFSNNGTGTMSDHIGKGLEVVSTGQVSLAGVAANNNQLFGASIQAKGPVSVINSVFNGNKSYYTCGCYKIYDGYGLKVVTDSDVHLNNVTANENYLFGAHLEGSYVEVSNSSFDLNASPFQKGKDPTGRGLEVKSKGDVLLTQVEANDNQLFGATIEAGGQVNVISSVFARNKYYTYSSCKGKKSAGYGLKVVTTDPSAASPITLTDVQAFGNGAEGAILQGESTVQVVNSSFNNNGSTGLSVTASGNVTLTNITADKNKRSGVYVKGTCTNTVIVNGGAFTNNSWYGIKIINAPYILTGTQTFAGNGYGNIFHSACP